MTEPSTPGMPSAPPPAPYTASATPMAPKTNTLAIVALILGFVFPLGGIICGHIALGQIKKTHEGGHGLALAGTILGYVFTAIWLIFIVIWVMAAIALASYGTVISNLNY